MGVCLQEKLTASAPEFICKYAAGNPDKCFEVGADTFVEMGDCAFRVIPGDYVTTDDGTGIVHIAPTFGADDAKVAKSCGYTVTVYGDESRRNASDGGSHRKIFLP